MVKTKPCGERTSKLWKMEVTYVLKINSFLVTIKRKKQPLWENQGKFYKVNAASDIIVK